jgi:hypothetical protein
MLPKLGSCWLSGDGVSGFCVDSPMFCPTYAARGMSSSMRQLLSYAAGTGKCVLCQLQQKESATERTC